MIFHAKSVLATFKPCILHPQILITCKQYFLLLLCYSSLFICLLCSFLSQFLFYSNILQFLFLCRNFFTKLCNHRRDFLLLAIQFSYFFCSFFLFKFKHRQMFLMCTFLQPFHTISLHDCSKFLLL